MSHVHRKPWWQIPERQVTSESAFLSRRGFIAGAISLTSLCSSALAQEQPLYPAKPSEQYQEETPSDPWYVTHYNNFYEFGSHKNIWQAAQALPLSPWTLTIDGLVEKPFQIDFDTLIRQVTLEERIYRLRCVEAWSFVVPWSGFPLKKLVERARPLSSARYLKMYTFHNPKIAIGQTQFWYPWPYTEGLTLQEATHDLAFLASGVYAKPLPPQNGAPLRLVVPWKYGFKSIKSIVRFEFTQERPSTFWHTAAPSEYGFWANVNPDVPHPRWSQKTEKRVDTGERIPTLLFNGYSEVASLYAELEQEALFR